MVRTSRIIVLAFVAALLDVLLPVDVASAHGDDPRIEIEVDQLAPGASLTVHGFDFSYEDDVAIVLTQSGRATELGSVTADLDGAFTHTVTVPLDAPEGVYAVTATTGHHAATSSPLLVRGQPLAANDDTRLDNEDSLLAPMPVITALTAASTVRPPAPAPAAVPPSASVENSVAPTATPTGGAGKGVTGFVVAAIATGIIVAGTWAVVRRRRARRPPSNPPEGSLRREPVPRPNSLGGDVRKAPAALPGQVSPLGQIREQSTTAP